MELLNLVWGALSKWFNADGDDDGRAEADPNG